MFSSGGEPAQTDDYDDCIAHADKNFADFLQLLASQGLAESTIVVFSADHGEAFLDHDNMVTHGGPPYAELIHVPLVVSWPGVLPAGKVFNESVSLLDVAPTILDYAGIPIPAQFQGMSLRGLIEGTGTGLFQDRTVFSYGERFLFGQDGEQFIALHAGVPLMILSPRFFRYVYEELYSDTFSAVKPPWALYCQYPNGPQHLYNLVLDPAEAEDVAQQQPQIVKEMRDQIEGYRRHEAELSIQLGTSASDRPEEFDNAHKETLRALGYLGR
jgi:arylsulfatase A-like enzyme